MMKSVLTLLFSLIFLLHQPPQGQGFKQAQLRYERVRNAYQNKENYLLQKLKERGIMNFDIQLFIRIFKQEQIVEAWVKRPSDNQYILLCTYPICQSSGDLGPKRQQGDGQVPEGVYSINRFNPVSNYYLSLGINYPNNSDRVRSDGNSPGGDIFIHGNCVTIGCVPITDDKIMELYLLAVEAREHGQNTISVHIFPYRMTSSNHQNFQKQYPEHKSFWDELLPVYNSFENNHVVPVVNIQNDGRYVVN